MQFQFTGGTVRRLHGDNALKRANIHTVVKLLIGNFSFSVAATKKGLYLFLPARCSRPNPSSYCRMAIAFYPRFDDYCLSSFLCPVSHSTIPVKTSR